MMEDFVPIKKVVISGATGEPIEFEPVKKIVDGKSVPLTTKEWAFKNIVRPTLEYGGLAGGALVGGTAGAIMGAPTGPGVAATSVTGGVLGGSLGYGIGKGAADIVEEFAGVKKPEALPERLMGTAEDLATGATMSMMDPATGKVISGVGSLAKQGIGKLTGTGTGSVEQAILGSPAFKNALRGKISPQEIVDHANSALSILKNNRADAYRSELAKISTNTQPIDMKPITDELVKLMKQYNVRVQSTGELDLSRIAMGKSGRNDIADLIMDIQGWGNKPGDNTVLGLDILKRRIDDFYSDSSQARQFVTSLRNVVDKTIKAAEPRYGDMTKGYAEATKLIKDIESNLMLRKQGMSGRITADQTLRRLTSAMRDNFELRQELVKTLGNEAAMDLSGEIAGHAMSTFMPRGISGSGLAATNATIAYLISPKIWPILVASSPRVSGEFLNMFGKALRETGTLGKEAGRKLIAYETVPAMQEEFARQTGLETKNIRQ